VGNSKGTLLAKMPLFHWGKTQKTGKAIKGKCRDRPKRWKEGGGGGWAFIFKGMVERKDINFTLPRKRKNTWPSFKKSQRAIEQVIL